ncbi:MULTISPECIES: CDP-diacylglycerol--glycerol-3-phosphate 3-phosphatidyltransferase [unclassified Neptuniibacter]|uniref:CDP-diacylglycerol--glycerol-3-phosphate 3-phosphatidyltransferase n=1 Tax=unclassified Neptuniibacter TaxID=2630693 RepID=UPI000C45BE88|nr:MULTISPECIES: CDP-diacylglycerol--glycerol-3-phosphate 3-phosphatidyltransferase [unclassified Neptuniibacter]MAY43524.1 CDP-diacylglycerol--glycerol-3-phosphate 3-phosphatidyltransferase [Oceanospirillaceae bacterium]|tara:strand:- start:138 stop:686 length:549 start_codon:yes stop_codon:yes gene_type:complete
MKIPNILTSLRILFIPIFVLVYYLPYEWAPLATGIIFAVAGFTDWLDGYLARKLDQTSPFGAFLDPVADKLMVVISLALLVEGYASLWVTIPAVVIIGREIVISALREWMAEIGKRANVAVSNIGKLKTALQMLAIMLMIVVEPYTDISYVGIAVLYAAAILTLWSMYQYLRAAWPSLSEEM